MIHHILYKITNLINGRFYIGAHSTDDLEDGYMGSGKQILASIKKYGKDNHRFEIVDTFSSRIELMDAEHSAVTEDLVQSRECMNMRVGGDGFSSADMKRLWSDPEFKEKQSAVKRGKIFTEEHKARLSAAAKIRQPQSAEMRTKNAASNTGKKMSPEARAKMSAAAKARRPMSIETKLKIKEASYKMWSDPEYRKNNLKARSV